MDDQSTPGEGLGPRMRPLRRRIKPLKYGLKWLFSAKYDKNRVQNQKNQQKMDLRMIKPDLRLKN